MNAAHDIDWYERRDELRAGQIFKLHFDNIIVRLDHRVPGDGTNWSCDIWIAGRPDAPGYERGHFSCEDFTIHPCDLEERLPEDFAELQP